MEHGAVELLRLEHLNRFPNITDMQVNITD